VIEERLTRDEPQELWQKESKKSGTQLSPTKPSSYPHGPFVICN